MNALRPRPTFQVLIMSEESRLGREQIQTAYALKQITDSNVRVFFYLEDRERHLDSATDKVMQSLTNFAAEFEEEKAVQRTRDTIRELYRGRLIYGKTRWEHCGDRRKVDTPAAEWITVEVPALRMTPSLSRNGASGKPGAVQMPLLGRLFGRPPGW
jgi:DNA invertase Pin-like site-specific DNA recombinase